MIAAAHLDNFLFLIFFGIAILFQLLTRAASKSGRRGSDNQKRSFTPPQQRPQRTEETEEDRIRKFLEALGQPTSSQPPSPVAPRPTYPKPIVVPRVEPRQIARRVLAPLPPLTTRPPEFEPSGQPGESQMPPPAPKRERRVFQPKSEIPAFEVQQAASPQAPITDSGTVPISGQKMPQTVSKSSEAKTDIPTLLKSTSGLRNAIILREIFGPPRSLQPLDLVGNV